MSPWDEDSPLREQLLQVRQITRLLSNVFIQSVLLLTLFFNHMGSVTPGFDTDFVDVNHDRDSAGVGGAQLHHLSSERVQKRMLLGGRRGPAGSALCAWGLVRNLPSLAGSG